MASILENIEGPSDLKGLSFTQLDQLAEELRAVMVAATSQSGGHLASSLGAVETILALHRVLDCPHDRIVFDVGHQAYAHKLVTGRYKRFSELRALDGISGFPKIDESPYDSHDSGHASDALSTALGYALARDIDGGDETIAVLVGDASFSGGMSLEALNQIGQSKTRLIIILNDNGMSISINVGGFSNFLGRVRLSDAYQESKEKYESTWESRGKIGQFVKYSSSVLRDGIKQIAAPEGQPFFEGFGVTYIGPFDGHDERNLEAILREAKEFDGPVLIHVVTKKGKGYLPAEQHPDTFHGVGPFDIDTGIIKKKSSAPSWTSVFSSELVQLAQEHEDVVAITAAMPSGTGLDKFEQRYPRRFFDVGIAEENAVGISSSLAMSGKTPFVAIYSTFIQRAFDQMIINVALQGQHVVFCLDRAGLVGQDGPTHHGAFDLSFMRMIPHMKVLAPSSDLELRRAVRTAYELAGPVCIRYGRGSAVVEGEGEVAPWEYSKARILHDGGRDVAFLAVGSMVKQAMQASRVLEAKGIGCTVWDMRWVKPVDAAAIEEACACDTVVTVEESTVVGGFGSAVLEELARQGISKRVHRLGLPDDFVGQGSVAELYKRCGLDAQGIADFVCEAR